MAAPKSKHRPKRGSGKGVPPAVEDSPDTYRALFDTLPQGIVHQDADGQIISMNPAAERILGKSPSDFLGETSVSVEHDTIHEDGSPFPGLEHPSMVALKTGKPVHDVVMGVFNPREKAYRWIEVTAVPLFKEGGKTPFQVYTVFEDITERRMNEEALRKSEQSYRSVVNAAPWGLHFYELKDDGRLVFTSANPAADKILGIDHSALIGKTMDEAFPATVGTEISEAYRRVARSGEAWHTERFDYADGSVHGAYEVHAFQPSHGKIAAAFMDITERTKAEENTRRLLKAVQQEKDRLSLLMNSMSDEVWFADKSGKFTIVNAPALKSFGLESSANEIDVAKLAHNLEVYRPDGSLRPVEEAPPLRALKGEVVLNEDESIRIPSTGEVRYRRVTSTPVRDASGAILGSISVVRDITEKRVAEEALKSTSAYLENLLNFANAPIIVWDASFNISRFNHAFEHMTGYLADEVIGKHLSILFPESSRASSLAKINQTLAGEHWKSVEIPILRKDGDIRLALWNSANVYADQDAKLVATIAQGQDITEMKAAEEELRSTRNYLESLFGYANAPIIVWNTSQKITRFNHAFEHLTGRKAEEVIGKDLTLLFPSSSKDSSLQKIGKTLGGEQWESVEIPILRKDGGVRVALWNSANIYAEDGKTLIATIAQGQDITERKEAETRLVEQSENLARSNMELQSFAYVASHDLKEPLRTISGFLQILETDYGSTMDDKAKDYIGRAVRASTRLHDMIDDLLSFSRLETQKKSFADIDLNEILSSVLHDLDKTLAEHNAKVTADRLPTVQADDHQMAILFRNLIDNAVKFHRDEPPLVTISTVKDDGNWVISFKDNGIGIDPTNYGKIFNMFTRLHSWKEYPGNGIGLAMCKKIVERHGGRIWVESEQGKGSNFIIMLPEKGSAIGAWSAPTRPFAQTSVFGSDKAVDPAQKPKPRQRIVRSPRPPRNPAV